MSFIQLEISAILMVLISGYHITSVEIGILTLTVSAVICLPGWALSGTYAVKT